MKNTAITVAHVSKTFKLPHERHNSLKSLFINILRHNRQFERQQALKDISFDIKQGEFFGILGRNGSGKSTLLKLLAGIYMPTSGNIEVNGKLTPFIELGVGFNGELTGRENVYLNGALLGFSKTEMDKMYDDIVAFAELERFMDQKLKNYSSGMQVRLAFSIAIRAKSDILLIDEVLAVGDAAFQRKCFSYFGDLKRNKQTVVFVSHDMESVRKYCDRAILIDNGVITESGDTEKVIKAYTRLFLEEEQNKVGKKKEKKIDVPLGMSPSSKIDRDMVSIDRVWVENDEDAEIRTLNEVNDYLQVKFSITAKRALKNFVPGVIVANAVGEFITASNSYWTTPRPQLSLRADEHVTICFRLPNIYEKGDYKISVNAVSADLETFYAWKNEVVNLYVDRKFMTGAKASPRYEVIMQS